MSRCTQRQQGFLNVTHWKMTSSHILNIMRNTHNCDWEKSQGEFHKFSIWTTGSKLRFLEAFTSHIFLSAYIVQFRAADWIVPETQFYWNWSRLLARSHPWPIKCQPYQLYLIFLPLTAPVPHTQRTLRFWEERDNPFFSRLSFLPSGVELSREVNSWRGLPVILKILRYSLWIVPAGTLNCPILPDIP